MRRVTYQSRYHYFDMSREAKLARIVGCITMHGPRATYVEAGQISLSLPSNPEIELALALGSAMRVACFGAPIHCDQKVVAEIVEKLGPEAIVRIIFSVITPEVRKAAAERPKDSLLFLAALNVFNEGERVTGKAIAREMRISRATLCRRYSADEIKRAVKTRFIGAYAESSGFETARKNGRRIKSH
jgi:hypothetical protein